jgi:hypothetical protein
MNVEKTNYQDTHRQVKYIQDTFSSNNVKVNQHSFLFKLLSNTLENYNDSNTPYEVFDALYYLVPNL